MGFYQRSPSPDCGGKYQVHRYLACPCQRIRPWSLVTTPYNYLLIIAGTVVIAIRFVGDAYLYRFQSASLLAAVLIPMALNIMYYLGLYLEGIDLLLRVFHFLV